MQYRKIAILVTSIAGFVLIVSGIIMAIKELSAKGVIDIKSVALSGKIETGSLGLLFTFLGVILLCIVILVRYKTTREYKEKSENGEIDWRYYEAGDPYCDLMHWIFPKEEVPEGVAEIAVCDWLSEPKIEEMVDSYLHKIANERVCSFIDYHSKIPRYKGASPGTDEVKKLLLELIDIIIDEQVQQEELSQRCLYLKDNNLAVEAVHMLSEFINYYFVEKKRIFAGWDKYPICYPPIHKELENWLVNIEGKWRDYLQQLRPLFLPGNPLI